MRSVVAVCAITAFAFLGPSAWAALHTPEEHVLDQFQEYNNYSYSVGIAGGATMMAQTFTAGLDGILCHIQIGNTEGMYWGTMSPPVVQIFEGQPGSWESLGSATLSYPMPYLDGGQWITPNMSGSPGPVGWTPLIPFNIPVTSGEMYSIVLSPSTTPGAVSVGATYNESYESGALWAYYEGDWLLSETDIGVYDMQFRTYVQAVPLPAGVWLGICAVSVAGWHLKRQRA